MMRPNINVRRGGGRIRGTKNQNPLQLDGRQVFGLVVVSVFVLSFLINSTPAIDTSVLLQNTTIFTNDKEGTAAMVSPKAGPASVTVTTTAPKAAASNTDTNANKRQTSRVIISTFVYGEAAMNSKRMRFFLKSVATSGLDYVMMGDAPPQFPLPPNVIHVTKTWNDLVDDIQKGIFHPQEQEQEQKQYQTLFDELKTAKVNKVNDFKPLFAFLYPHLVEGYDWWGWSDK